MTILDQASYELATLVDSTANGCNQWESEFLDSILKQLKAGRWLSHAQRARLRQIQEERCGGTDDETD